MREKLAAKLERLKEKERDIAISPHLKTDRVYQKAEEQRVELRRKLHIIRQNLQKKDLSIKFQKKRLAETVKLYQDFEQLEEDHKEKLNGVEAQIKEIKTRYAKQLENSGD